MARQLPRCVAVMALLGIWQVTMASSTCFGTNQPGCEPASAGLSLLAKSARVLTQRSDDIPQSPDRTRPPVLYIQRAVMDSGESPIVRLNSDLDTCKSACTSEDKCKSLTFELETGACLLFSAFVFSTPDADISPADPVQMFYKATWERITCPVIGALFKNADLVPDVKGLVTRRETLEALLRVGISRETAELTTAGNFDHLPPPHSINIFDMDLMMDLMPSPGKSLEHEFSTGLRDRFAPSWELYAKFEQFIGTDGDGDSWSQKDVDAAIAFFVERPNDLGTGPGSLESIKVMLQEFGDHHLSRLDMMNLFMKSDYPAAFRNKRFTPCAKEGSQCHCEGVVRFGIEKSRIPPAELESRKISGDTWIQRGVSSNVIQCTVSRFGADPAPGLSKTCECSKAGPPIFYIQRAVSVKAKTFAVFRRCNLEHCKAECSKRRMCESFTYHVADRNCKLNRGFMPSTPDADTSPADEVQMFYKADWERITCPVIGALFRNKDIVPDEEGSISKQQTFDALSRVGVSEGVAELTTAGNFDHLPPPHSINMFDMDFIMALKPGEPPAHDCSTGLRDTFKPKWKLYPEFEQFIDIDGDEKCWSQEDVDAAIDHFAHTSNNLGTCPGTLASIKVMLREFGFKGRLCREEMRRLFLASQYPAHFRIQ